MIESIRQAFNSAFTVEQYADFLNDLHTEFGYVIPFRVAETPVFFPETLAQRLFEASADIVKVLTQPDFKALSAGAVPPAFHVPGETDHTLFLAIDFAVCKDEAGELTPQLIELQGCPSLYYYQPWLAQKFKQHYPLIDDAFSVFPGEMTEAAYYELLKTEVLGDHEPENVIILEIEPEKQNTNIDFLCTEAKIDVKAICVSAVIPEGDKLYYFREGVKTQIKRIYNRLIFDEYAQRTDIRGPWDPTMPADIEWAGHPNWFFRISKHTMPLIDSPFVPKTWYLDQLETIPSDLENYVLKPLFSFSGAGVMFNVTREDVDAVEDRSNYILQRKVQYAPVIATPDGQAKCEVRLLYVWPEAAAEPIPVLNLVRLSKGDMIGVKYNMEKTWVGGTVGFFSK